MSQATTYDAKLGVRCRSAHLEELKVRAARTRRRQQDVLDEILCHAFGRADLLPPGQSARRVDTVGSL